MYTLLVTDTEAGFLTYRRGRLELLLCHAQASAGDSEVTRYHCAMPKYWAQNKKKTRVRGKIVMLELSCTVKQVKLTK